MHSQPMLSQRTLKATRNLHILQVELSRLVVVQSALLHSALLPFKHLRLEVEPAAQSLAVVQVVGSQSDTNI